MYNLNDLSKDILKSFLYQVSVGRFKNETVREQPPFYSLIVYSVDDNHISPEEEKELIKLISHELSYYYINQFIKISNGVTNDIYIPYPDKIVFTREFVELIKEKGDSIESRVLYRLFYFLEKINDNLNAVKAYESNIRRGLDKEDFEYKFEYEKNLDQLKRSLTEDLYLKNYFKSLMKQYGIPSTEKYLRMCLDRIDYSLKTKQIILSSKYPTLKAYYKEEVLKNDIYRYSNPLNLDEYDTALKSLQYDLLLIEVGNGVYLTRVNMEKNGINEDVIRDFHNEIEKIGHELKYFSIKEIEEIMPGNPIVEYCNGDKKQLVQFIKPVPNIKIINIGKKGIILSFTNSKKYRGEFIEFIMGNRNKMDLYEIKDFVENTFDVEYSLDEIIKDVSQTTFYYSEEMEKVYKHKEDYIREVYYDGN